MTANRLFRLLLNNQYNRIYNYAFNSIYSRILVELLLLRRLAFALDVFMLNHIQHLAAKD